MALAEGMSEAVRLNLLKFQQDIVEELLNQDGLTIMGKGLGMCTAVAGLLAIHQLADDSGGVTIIIGSNATQRAIISAELARLLPNCSPPPDVSAEVLAADRTDLYTSVKHLFITTRILVVDLLSDRLPPKQVAGLIVMNAHRVTEHSGEGFATRLFRQGNDQGFVRAFSEEPMQFHSGVTAVDKVMRALYVRQVFLWPRFQETVQSSLQEVEVCEVECEMSPSMMVIQTALVKILDSLVREVQRANRLDSTELDLANAFFRSFEHIIRRQLNPIWNTLASRTQQLVRDMRTLQELTRYLLRFNPVSFLRYIQCLKSAAGTRTEWLLHSAANLLFQEAKARVYCLTAVSSASKKKRARDASSDPPAGGSSGGMALTPILEGMPKWQLLTSIMEEVQMHRTLLTSHAMSSIPGAPNNSGSTAKPATANTTSATNPAVEVIAGASGSPSAIEVDVTEVDGEDEYAWIQQLNAAQAAEYADADVFVIAKEKYMLTELRAVLQPTGGRAFLHNLYDMYLVERLTGSDTPGKSSRRGGRTGRGGRGTRGRGSADAATSGRGGGRTKKEHSMYKLQQLSATTEEEKAMFAAAESVAAAMDKDAQSTTRRSKVAAKSKASEQFTDAVAGDGTAAEEEHPLLQNVKFISMDEASDPSLWATKPVFVILYDVDLAWTRQLEVFQSLNPGHPLKVYMLNYRESIDTAKFQMSAEKEKDSFINLIQKKAHMVMPIDEAGKQVIVGQTMSELARHRLTMTGSNQTGNALTRKMGGSTVLPRRVIVDVREFMSALPAVLHQQGMEVVPLTLQVADFVLSDDICIERKAIPDLISSLDSGRLFAQAEAMSKNYATPVLLIEFDPDKSFALQSNADLGDEIRGGNVLSKLVLLLLHFPKLRVLWSRSLHATADLFFVLKRNREDPDPASAALVGITDAPIESGAVSNPVARELLLRMPGVTEANIRVLMLAAGTLSGLGGMTQSQVQAAIGMQAGKSLFEFLHTRYPVE